MEKSSNLGKVSSKEGCLQNLIAKFVTFHMKECKIVSIISLEFKRSLINSREMV